MAVSRKHSGEKWELSLMLIWKTNEVIERLFLLSSHQPGFSAQCNTGWTRTGSATVKPHGTHTTISLRKMLRRLDLDSRASGIPAHSQRRVLPIPDSYLFKIFNYFCSLQPIWSWKVYVNWIFRNQLLEKLLEGYWKELYFCQWSDHSLQLIFCKILIFTCHTWVKWNRPVQILLKGIKSTLTISFYPISVKLPLRIERRILKSYIAGSVLESLNLHQSAIPESRNPCCQSQGALCLKALNSHRGRFLFFIYHCFCSLCYYVDNKKKRHTVPAFRLLHFTVSILSRFSSVWFCATLQTRAGQAPVSMGYPGKNTGEGRHFLLQTMIQNLKPSPGFWGNKQGFDRFNRGSIRDGVVPSALNQRTEGH